MGSPSMNLLEGRVSRSNGVASVVIERAGTVPIAFPVPTSANVETLSEGARVIFGIRPEAISDLESVNAKSKSITTFTSEVEIVEPAGSDTFVVTSIAGKVVTARMRSDSDIRVGESHVFALNLDKAVLFDPATTHRI
jgi:multiple sugar transport system ATP-binding protein